MSTASTLIGTTIAGRYRIEARVGSGAMGAVYRAEQAGLGRRVALKIVNRDRQVDGDTLSRFRREATALSALHHPNTVRVFDFGSTTNGLLFLAMELLEGE
ncbi:MAG TPA: protein kinase, partial [Polyangiales bacterium]|nr:protein kinase [Polyangiales bacterium]